MEINSRKEANSEFFANKDRKGISLMQRINPVPIFEIVTNRLSRKPKPSKEI